VEKPGSRIWIRFQSVATDATVWVNGIQVGRHVGDYIPFQFEITEAVGERMRRWRFGWIRCMRRGGRRGS
jgi:hypothetical protein